MLTSDDDLRDFNRYITWGDYKIGNEDVGRSDVKKKILDRILSQTNVKRACCSKKDTVNIRIPIPSNINLNEYSDKKDIYSKYGYFDVAGVKIDQNTCPNDHKNFGAKCDTFYNVYCANVLQMYKDQQKQVYGPSAEYNHKEFIRYKPECACFGDISVFSEIPETFPRKCVFGGCSEGGKAYMDPGSRNQNCSLNVCKSIISAANADVGGSVNMKSNIQQKCGASLPAKDKAALDSQLRAEEDKKRQARLDAEEAERKRLADIAAKKAAEEAEKKRLEEAEAKRKSDEAAAKKAAEEEATRIATEKANKAKADAEAAATAAAEAQSAEEQAKAQAEANRLQKEADEAAKKAAEAETRRQQAAEQAAIEQQNQQAAEQAAEEAAAAEQAAAEQAAPPTPPASVTPVSTATNNTTSQSSSGSSSSNNKNNQNIILIAVFGSLAGIVLLLIMWFMMKPKSQQRRY